MLASKLTVTGEICQGGVSGGKKVGEMKQVWPLKLKIPNHYKLS